MVMTPLFSRNVPGGIFTIQDLEAHPRYVWFVDSAHANASNSAGNGRSPDSPFATLAYAFSSDLVGAGDVVYVMPGHTETIATAAAIAQDIAGVKVIGLGWGANRPTFTFSATGSTWAISAASSVVKNIRVTSSVNELVKMFNITAADVTLDAVDYIDPGAALETIQFVLTTSAADRLTIKNCKHFASTAPASAQKWISLVGCDNPTIVDNVFMLTLNDAATSSVIAGDASVVGAELGRNKIQMKGYSANMLSAVLMASGATGIHYDSRIYADVAVTTTINDCPTMASFEVYCSNDLDKNGILDPVVGT